MLKRLLFVLLTCSFLVGAVACGDDDGTPADSTPADTGGGDTGGGDAGGGDAGGDAGG